MGSEEPGKVRHANRDEKQTRSPRYASTKCRLFTLIAALSITTVFFLALLSFQRLYNMSSLSERLSPSSTIYFQGIAREAENRHKEANAPLTSSETGERKPPKVAFLFIAMGELFNEPIWRAFFEAAGSVSFRVEPLESPYVSFIYGDGKDLFHKISSEKTIRALSDVGRTEGDDICTRENELVASEVERLMSNEEKDVDVISKQTLFSVYTHPTVGFNYTEDSIFFGTEIAGRLDMAGAWGHFKLINVEIKLLKAALIEESNRKFVLLSESCVPLYRPEVIYLQLLSEEKSRSNACGPWFQSDYKRWNDHMQTPHLHLTKWRKSHQWFCLNREHAELIVTDTHLQNTFRKYCRPVRGHFCVSDEHYIPVMLSIYGLEDETDCIGNVTRSLWLTRPSAHPTSFMPDAINAALFETLRNGRNCPFEEAHLSSQNVFTVQNPRSRCLQSNKDRRLRSSTHSDNWIVQSGYRPLGYNCSLFARKFPKAAVQQTLRTALACNGSALGYWC